MTSLNTTLRQTRDSASSTRSQPVSPITATNVQDALSQIASGVVPAGPATTPPALTPTTVNLADSPYTVLTTDYILLVDTSGGAITINLGAAAARNNRDLVIKDSSGNAAANNITINRNGADTIDGAASYVMASNFDAYRLTPKTGGYSVTT